jgi:hypothetical protein
MIRTEMLLEAAGGRSAISRQAPVPFIAECALLRRKRTAELANRIPSLLRSSPWARGREPRCARRSDTPTHATARVRKEPTRTSPKLAPVRRPRTTVVNPARGSSLAGNSGWQEPKTCFKALSSSSVPASTFSAVPPWARHRPAPAFQFNLRPESNFKSRGACAADRCRAGPWSGPLPVSKGVR